MRAPIRACHSHQTITKLFGCLSKEVVEKLGCISRDRVGSLNDLENSSGWEGEEEKEVQELYTYASNTYVLVMKQ